MEDWTASEGEASTQEESLSSQGRMRVGDTFKLWANCYLSPKLISLVL